MKKKDILLHAALKLARTRHYKLIEFAELAADQGCSEQLVKYYFGNLRKLQDSIVVLAKEVDDKSVLQQAQAEGDLNE